MTTIEIRPEAPAGEQNVDTARPMFTQFKEWVMSVVHGNTYPESTATGHSTFPGQNGMTPRFQETHLPANVKNYVIDYPFAD